MIPKKVKCTKSASSQFTLGKIYDVSESTGYVINNEKIPTTSWNNTKSYKSIFEPYEEKVGFKKDEYIVPTRSANSGISANYCYKQYVGSFLFNATLDSNGYSNRVTEIQYTHTNWRYATKEEGERYEREGKPFDTTKAENGLVLEVGKYYTSFDGSDSACWNIVKCEKIVSKECAFGPFIQHSKKFKTNSMGVSSHYASRLATQEEIAHLNACIAAGKYVEPPKDVIGVSVESSLPFPIGTRVVHSTKGAGTVRKYHSNRYTAGVECIGVEFDTWTNGHALDGLLYNSSASKGYYERDNALKLETTKTEEFKVGDWVEVIEKTDWLDIGYKFKVTADNGPAVKDIIWWINKSKIKKIPEPKKELIPGKWYKIEYSSRIWDFIQYKGTTPRQSYNQIDISAYIHSEKGYRTDSNSFSNTLWEKSLVEADMSEVEKYLPKPETKLKEGLWQQLNQKEEIFPGVTHDTVLVYTSGCYQIGWIGKPLSKSRKGELWTEQAAGPWTIMLNAHRIATPEEIKFYNEGGRNIKDMKPGMYGNYPYNDKFINTYGLKIGDTFEYDAVLAWIKKDKNIRWSDVGWVVFFGDYYYCLFVPGGRIIQEFKELDGVVGFRPSGFSTTFIKAEGFKDFCASFGKANGTVATHQYLEEVPKMKDEPWTVGGYARVVEIASNYSKGRDLPKGKVVQIYKDGSTWVQVENGEYTLYKKELEWVGMTKPTECVEYKGEDLAGKIFQNPLTPEECWPAPTDKNGKPWYMINQWSAYLPVEPPIEGLLDPMTWKEREVKTELVQKEELILF